MGDRKSDAQGGDRQNGTHHPGSGGGTARGGRNTASDMTGGKLADGASLGSLPHDISSAHGGATEVEGKGKGRGGSAENPREVISPAPHASVGGRGGASAAKVGGASSGDAGGSGGSARGGAGTSGALASDAGAPGSSQADGTGGALTLIGGGPSVGDATSGRATGGTMSCEGVLIPPASLHIEAECAHGRTVGKCDGQTSGAQSQTQLENGDTTVGCFEPGDWLSYTVDLTGMTLLRIAYAKGIEGGGVEARLDSPTGTCLGSFKPAPTGSWSTWAEATLRLTATQGMHALYLVATGTSTEGVMNIDWIELSDGSEDSAPPVSFHTNQLGYDSSGPKHAVIETAATPDRFYLVDGDRKVQYCGFLERSDFSAWGGSPNFYSINFDDLSRTGTYRLLVDGRLSDSFEISRGRYFEETMASVLDYFKRSRADEDAVWAADTAVELADGSGTADLRGGWYDASGDISKYFSHLSYANFFNPQQIPLVTWALAWVHDEGATLLDATGLGGAVEVEALWGADYLLRSLTPAGYFYSAVFDGWSGDLAARTICALEGQNGTMTSAWQAAFREGGGVAIAALARVARWGVAGSFSAADYLAGAERAFAHLVENNTSYDDNGIENVIDDYAALLGASELFAATSDSSYLEAARGRATSLVQRLHPTGYFVADGAERPFWHASDAGLPVVALARYVDLESDSTARDRAIQAMKAHLDYLVRVTREVANPFGYARQHVNAGTTVTSGFFIPHANETGYWWQGENARLASLSAAALIGGRKVHSSSSGMLRVPDDLARYAAQQLDWILGNNPYDICFLQGFGRNNPPGYCGAKEQSGTHAGGIANGITGAADDGTGIQWTGATTRGSCWDDWRWTEQWLPHSTWYMVAITAMAL